MTMACLCCRCGGKKSREKVREDPRLRYEKLRELELPKSLSLLSVVNRSLSKYLLSNILTKPLRKQVFSCLSLKVVKPRAMVPVLLL